MDLSLAYRIASMSAVLPSPAVCPPGVDWQAVRQRAVHEAEMVKRATRFRLDNIAEFYAGHERDVWDMADDIPNWAPPFPLIFAEWTEPTVWNIGGRQEESNLKGGQVGFLCMAFPVTDENRGDLAGWNALAAKLAGSPAFSADADVFREILSGAWVLCCSRWSSVREKPLCGAPLWQGIYHFVGVSRAGRHIRYFSSGLTAEWTNARYGAPALSSPLAVFGLGLSFCHCKNVVRAETEDGRGERWHRRTGVPRLRTYTLNIDPMKEVLRREGGSEEHGLARALHICRGHFATYGEEKPLFGRLAGTFWRPDHVRGQASAGVVAKDYAVAPGLPKAAPGEGE